MTINELPEEILVRILSFLPRSDRLESALTCRRWAQTVARAPSLLRDIWLVIREEAQIEEARRVFATSQRQYENLRLDRVSLPEFNAAFWTSVGPGLRKLELNSCDHSLEVFYYILQACSNLESLKIHEFGRGGFTDQGSELAPGMNLESIRNSMRNLRHLHLDFNVDADTLERLLILMPNVTSIALWLFEWESDSLSRLRKMLGASRGITMLCLYSGSSDDDAQLLRISPATLQSLIYHEPAPIVLDELRNCPMLRDLDLYWARPLNDSDIRLLQNIPLNVPELEVLRIYSEESRVIFKREHLMPIFDLRKLRKLDIYLKLVTDQNIHVPGEIVGDLSRMVSLGSLSVGSQLGIIDSTRFRILASIPNLRELAIHHLEWDAECVRIILFHLGQLKTLKILGGHFRSWYVPGWRDQYPELERNISIAKGRQGEQKFSSLEVLVIENCPLTDASLARITAHHGRLRIVELSECRDITDAGLVTLFQHEPLLEELSIGVLSDLDGTFLDGLGESCRRLRSLRVDSHWISFQALEEFKSRRPRVKLIYKWLSD